MPVKFRVSLVCAFLVTSLVLFTNAYEVFAFQQTNAVTSSVDVESGPYSELTSNNLIGESRYDRALSLNISQRRSQTLIDAAFSDTSCVEAYYGEKDRSDVAFIESSVDEKLIPASANKIMTAAVVLSIFKPEDKLSTDLIADSDSANLKKAYVRPSADPSFVTTTVPPARRKAFLSPTNIRTFEDFANNIYDAGIRSITVLTIDNTWFDIASIENGWSDDREQVGALAALNVDEGFVNGELSLNPDKTAVDALVATLEARGISIGATGFGKIPNGLTTSGNVRASTQSVPITTLVQDMLQTSDNVYAEQLLAAATHEKVGIVTRESRQNVTLEVMQELLGDTSEITFENGSGYTREARLSCSTLNDIIDAMYNKGIDIPSMSAVAGETGTLTERFVDFDEKLEAKTGTLDGVTALSGAVGDRVTFSFLTNAQFSQDQGFALQETAVSIISDFPYFPALEL